MSGLRDAHVPLALVFRALADPSRLAIVGLLQTGEWPVGALAIHLGLSQATVSQHLFCLRQAGLVAVRRCGRKSLYRVANPGMLRNVMRAAMPMADSVTGRASWGGRRTFAAARGRRPDGAS